MGQITRDQSHQVIATLMTNTDWSQIDFAMSGLQDAVIRDPKGVGERFTAFLKNGANMQRVESAQASTPATRPTVLQLVSHSVQLDAITAYNPHELTTCKGLWVSDQFISLVRSKAKPIENLGAASLKSYVLNRNAYDREITPELGEGYKFVDESEVCARIARMIAKQANGEKGDLLNNGYANLFYVADCVVIVDWYADYREWYVYSWTLDDDYWIAGRRVFSRN